MTKCTHKSFNFPDTKSLATSDDRVMLLRQVDRYIGLRKSVAQALEDSHQHVSCKYDGVSILRQWIYALASGYDMIG